MTLIDSSSCELSIAHYSFQRVFKKISFEINQFMKVMCAIFKDSPTRREIYIRICEGEVFQLAQPV